MKFLAINNETLQWWDSLCKQHSAPVFAYSFYWKSLADQAVICVNEKMNGGIVIPLITKAGIQQVYTPNFYRYSSWIGVEPSNPDWKKILIEQYKVGHFHLESSTGSRCFQQIDWNEDWVMNSQAKRMVKKAKDMEIVVSEDFNAVFSFVRHELGEKISSIAASDWSRLENMLVEAKRTGHLEILELVANGQLEGGLLLLHTPTRTLYLKGTVTAEAKTKGGMYYLMDYAIQTARTQQRTFDFGGSNAEGVKQFNHNLGGKDTFYEVLEWNNAPLWWRIARGIKKRLKK